MYKKLIFFPPQEKQQISYFLVFEFFLHTEIQFIIIKWLKLLYFFLLFSSVWSQTKTVSDNLIFFDRVIYEFEIKGFCVFMQHFKL